MDVTYRRRLSLERFSYMVSLDCLYTVRRKHRGDNSGVYSTHNNRLTFTAATHVNDEHGAQKRRDIMACWSTREPLNSDMF